MSFCINQKKKHLMQLSLINPVEQEKPPVLESS